MLEDDIKLLVKNELAARKEDFIAISDVDAYVKKLVSMAEILTHYSRGRMIGCIAYYCNNSQTRTAFLSLIIVSPESRGSGLADVLLDQAIGWARKNQMEALALEVRKGNERALHFYENRGFEVKYEELDIYGLELPVCESVSK
ncbi:GNAT family N-acetyltransferase [Halomonas nitroreducens]|uniref:GNAT family N-acetyltransferase n=1 Tax=Halomonas nitroreducens TaxID=447425 RepID=A0A3S0I8Y4_9GAMM|nr:GNAT family N-acetyltransferase [Halomonas nitroreducens]RTR05329.1 GNAT family N-acetyltransferase [Halomonas nitroreducens]